MHHTTEGACAEKGGNASQGEKGGSHNSKPTTGTGRQPSFNQPGARPHERVAHWSDKKVKPHRQDYWRSYEIPILMSSNQSARGRRKTRNMLQEQAQKGAQEGAHKRTPREGTDAHSRRHPGLVGHAPAAKQLPCLGMLRVHLCCRIKEENRVNKGA